MSYNRVEKVLSPQFQELAMFILKCTSHCPVHLQEDFSHHQPPMNTFSSISWQKFTCIRCFFFTISCVSVTYKETTFALSPTAKDSASAVLQESNHTSELQYSSLLSEKPKLLIPTPEFFPKGDGTRSKRECNTKTKLVAKLMRQNSKKVTVPCQPAIEVESYIPLAQYEVQHWVPGLTTEDKKMITSGGWLSDEIVDAVRNY